MLSLVLAAVLVGFSTSTSTWQQINPLFTYDTFANAVGDNDGNVVVLGPKNIIVASSPPYTKWSFDRDFWLTKFPPKTDIIGSISHSGKIFLANSDSTLATSADGKKWAFHAGRKGNFPWSDGHTVLAGNGLFLNIGLSKVGVSKDGVTWNTAAAPFPQMASYHVFYDGHAFVSAGIVSDGTQGAMATIDGSTWFHYYNFTENLPPGWEGMGNYGGAGCPGKAQMINWNGAHKSSGTNWYIMSRSENGGKTWDFVDYPNGTIYNLDNPICLGGGTNLCAAFAGPEMAPIGKNIISTDCGKTWQVSKTQLNVGINTIPAGAAGYLWGFKQNGNIKWDNGLGQHGELTEGLPLKGPYGYLFDPSHIKIVNNKVWLLVVAQAHPENATYTHAGLWVWDGAPGAWSLQEDLGVHSAATGSLEWYPALSYFGITFSDGFLLYDPVAKAHYIQCYDCFKGVGLSNVVYDEHHNNFVASGGTTYNGPPQGEAWIGVGTWNKKAHNITDWKVTLSSKNSKGGPDGIVSRIVTLPDNTLIVNWCIGFVSVLRYTVSCDVMSSSNGGMTWANDAKYTVPPANDVPLQFRLEGGVLFAYPVAAFSFSGCQSGKHCNETWATKVGGGYNQWQQLTGGIKNGQLFYLPDGISGHNWAVVSRKGWFLGDYSTNTWTPQPKVGDGWSIDTFLVSAKGVGHFALDRSTVWMFPA